MSRRLGRSAIPALVGGLIGVAGLVFVARTVYAERSTLGDALADASVGWLVLAGVSGLAAMATIAAWWIAIVRSRGGAIKATGGLRWYFVGALGKYVPGGVWPVVGTAELAVRGGVDRSTAYQSTLLSMFATYAAAVAVGGAAALFVGGWYTAAGCAALAGSAIVFWLLGHRFTHGVLARLSSERFALPARRRLIEQTLRHCLVWVLLGLGTWCTLRGIGDHMSLVRVGAITAAAWVVGFVVIGVPGGIGVRESVYIALLAGELGKGQATAVALLARLVSIGADVAGAVLVVTVLPVLARVGRAAPPTEPAQGAAPS